MCKYFLLLTSDQSSLSLIASSFPKQDPPKLNTNDHKITSDISIQQCQEALAKLVPQLWLRHKISK
jgi:hypothetical protein